LQADNWKSMDMPRRVPDAHASLHLWEESSPQFQSQKIIISCQNGHLSLYYRHMTGGTMNKEIKIHKEPERLLYAMLDTLDKQQVHDAAAVGYRNLFDNKIQLNRLIMSGLSYSLFETMQDKTPFTKNEWANFLDVSIKTLDRHKQANKPFKTSQSEKIIGMMEVLERGIDVFGKMGIFKPWLYSTIPAFGDMRPIDLLSTSYGRELVLDELTRIEHGIFA